MPEIVSGAEYARFINTLPLRAGEPGRVVRINIDIVDQVPRNPLG